MDWLFSIYAIPVYLLVYAWTSWLIAGWLGKR